MKSQIRIRTVLINGKVVEKRINGKKMEEKRINVKKNGRKTDQGSREEAREEAKKKVPHFPTPQNFNLHLLEKLTSTLQDTRLDAVQPATEPGTMSKTIFRICGPYQTEHSAVQHTTKIMGKEWTTMMVDDDKADTFWSTYFPADHLIRTAYYMINPKFGASRADILRLALVYIHGGMYLDFKSSVLQVPPSLSEHKQIGVCQWPKQKHLFPNGELTNWFILGKSGSPVLWMALVQIAKMVHYLHSNQNILNLVTDIADDDDSISKRLVLTVTGPVAFTFVLQQHLKYVECSYLPYVKYDFTKKHQAGENHYSMQSHTEYLLNWTNKTYNIPRTLYMTYKNIKSVPPDVIVRAQTLHPELTLCFFDNDQCRQFLTEYFPAIVLYTFDSLKSGAHKADLWRYCILYVRGGFYCDVKTDFVCSLLDFVTEENSKTWYTVIGYEGTPKQLYNGIIITPPFNPILYKNIEFICTNKCTDYLYNVKYLYTSVQAQVNHTLCPGFNKMENGWSIYLAKEHVQTIQPRMYYTRSQKQNSSEYKM